MPIDYSHQHLSSSVMEEGSPHTPISTGGSSIDATDTQIVFMDGDTPVGSANLTWDDAGGRLTIGAAPSGTYDIRVGAPGAQLFVIAADGDADNLVGGELTLKSGRGADGGDGGALSIISGGVTAGDGDSGPILIKTSSGAGSGGDIDILAGGGGNSGGNVGIHGGLGAAGDGGDIIIGAGAKLTSGSYGSVQIYEGSGSNAIELNSSGLFVSALAVFVPGLPTLDPGVADQLWNDAGTLKISAG